MSCKALIEAAVARYEKSHPKSCQYHQESLQSLPGGNTRTLLHMDPFPVVMERGEGCRLYDLDGHVYIDFVSEMTAGIYGHSNSLLKKSIVDALDVGLSLGATNVYEKRFAEALCSRFGLESIRFTNSGTEANLHCTAAARAFTGRRKIVVFRGGYHGSVLAFGEGVAANDVDAQDWIVCQYNDVAALETIFAEQGDKIAAVLMEGMQSSGGAVAATKEFLRAVRTLTKKSNSLFLLDEVVTSRLSPGGLAATFDPDTLPDMKSFGKYLGGGMPFGAFGGRRDVMAVYDPRSQGALSHSGTFQNNTLMLHAGFTAVSKVYTPEVAVSLNGKGDQLRNQLLALFAKTRFTVIGRGSLLCIHVTTTGRDGKDLQRKDDWASVNDVDVRRLFWLEMLEQGFWMHPRGSVALNLALGEAETEAFLAAVGRFCKEHADLIRKEE